MLYSGPGGADGGAGGHLDIEFLATPRFLIKTFLVHPPRGALVCMPAFLINSIG